MELIFTCVILLFDFAILIRKFASISRLSEARNRRVEKSPTRRFFERNVSYTDTFRRSKSDLLDQISIIEIWVSAPRFRESRNSLYTRLFQKVLIWTILVQKIDEVLRNVVLGTEEAKMAQKQHIGNFQI